MSGDSTSDYLYKEMCVKDMSYLYFIIVFISTHDCNIFVL